MDEILRRAGLFQGVDPAKAVNRGAVDDASLVDHFLDLARRRG